jgi:2-C-methyl-D-erythritol 2,4-cyclodiphosphate synthase
VTDAVLGAMCEGDIGVHFPDKDPRWKDADSMQLLARVMWLAGERGYRIVNLDATVMLERPRLRPYVDEMRARHAEVLGVELDCVSVKAKSGEGLDAVGESRAVTVQAVALLEKF